MRVKDGRQNNGRQRYKCKSCHRKQQALYSYNAYQKGINDEIVTLTKEESASEVQHGSLISFPQYYSAELYNCPDNLSSASHYSKDLWSGWNKELCTKKVRTHLDSICLDRKSKQVVSYNIGPRTNATFNVVLETLRLSDAKWVYTDRLRNYRSLIETKIHRTSLYGTNHIERHNLTIRTHLKRLARKTICFSRSAVILLAILNKIYFWG